MRTLNHVFFATLAAAALVLLGAATAPAVSFSLDTADGSGADSYVRLGEPTSNKGGESRIFVKDSGSSSTTRKGYLQFNVSSLAGNVFTDATLTLDVTVNNSGGSDPTPQSFTVNVFGLNDAHAGESWGESTIIWTNAPANDTANNYITNDAAFLGRFTVLALSTSTVTFSEPELASFLSQDSDDKATLILTRQGGNGGYNLGFASKEDGSANAPLVSGTVELGDTLSLTTNDGNGADSFVRKGEADTNFGTETGLLTKNAGTSSTTRKSYLRFDLSSLTAEALDVSLMLDVTTNDEGGGGTTPQDQLVNVYGLDDLDAGENWGETTITWNNAPANDTNDNDLLGNATLLGQFTVPAIGLPSEILFSSQALVDFINADTNGLATLILTRDDYDTNWNLAFASGEHGSLLAPTLTIAYAAAIPEPSTLLIWAFGLMGLAWWRRRK